MKGMPLPMTTVIRFFILLALILAPVSGPLAKGVDLKGIVPLKPVDFIPKAEFEAKTKLVSEVPFGDRYLAYQMRLPSDWTRAVDPPRTVPDARMQMSDRVLGIIGEYVSPPRLDLRSMVTIEALELAYEINAKNWFINYMLANGYTPTALTEISETEIEAIYVDVQKDTTFVVRLKAIINGPRVVIFRYFLPQQDVQNERVMQAQIVNSFRLTNAESETIERRSTFEFLDQSFFDYPASWKAETPRFKSIERMKGLLYTGIRREAPDAQVNVYLVSRLLGTTLADEVAQYKSKISIPGYELKELIETIDYTDNPDMEFSATEVYRLAPQETKMKDYEMVVAVMQGGDYFYIMTMLTQSRQEDFYLWARNMRAFRVMAESMRRYNDAGDSYQELPDAAVEPPPSDAPIGKAH